MSNQQNNAPDFIVYHVKEGDKGRKGSWYRIGAAWQHGDGNGFNIELELQSPTGKLVLRPPLERKDDAGE